MSHSKTLSWLAMAALNGRSRLLRRDRGRQRPVRPSKTKKQDAAKNVAKAENDAAKMQHEARKVAAEDVSKADQKAAEKVATAEEREGQEGRSGEGNGWPTRTASWPRRMRRRRTP